MAKKEVRPSKAKCPHCGKELIVGSRFCKHCGASMFPKKLSRKHHCPSCKGVVEEFSRFCKHCGANIDTFFHAKFVKFLVYIVLFLVVVLALLLFFTPPGFDQIGPIDTGEKEVSFDVSQAFIKMSDGLCSWKDGSFKLCTTVNWKGDVSDYALCNFDGGSVDGDEIHQSPFTCCSNVGEEEGLNLVRAYLFNKEGEAYKDTGTSVACTGKPEIYKHTIKTNEIYTKKFWFTAKQTAGRGRGEGTIFLDFPGIVKSCTYDGFFVNRPTFLEGFNYCRGARGSFFGEADLYGQEVVADAEKFNWAGGSVPGDDPSPVIYEGYGLYFLTCDPKYYTDPHYYVSGKFSDFETDTLRFDWFYYNDYPSPEVDVSFEMQCEIEI